MNSLTRPTIATLLNRLHAQANRELPAILKGLAKGVFRPLRPEDMAKTFIAMNREQGELMCKLIRASGAKHIVEFGTSFGISTFTWLPQLKIMEVR